MKINSLTVRNFRKFEQQSFVFHPQFNALIGENATGKTQILDALSIILGIYQTKMFNREKVLRGIQTEEVRVCDHPYPDETGQSQIRREPQFPVSLDAEITYRAKRFEQNCAKITDSGRTTFGRTSQFSKLAQAEYNQVQNGEGITLPLLVYYGSGRLWPLKRHFENEDSVPSRTDGYVNSLDPNTDIKEIQGGSDNKSWFICKRKKRSPRWNCSGRRCP